MQSADFSRLRADLHQLCQRRARRQGSAFQARQRAFSRPQHMQVGRHWQFCRKLQRGIQHKAAQPCMGIALGFQPGVKVVQTVCLTHRCCKAVLQSLADTAQLRKIFRWLHPQLRQDRHLKFCTVEQQPLGSRLCVKRRCTGGHKGGPFRQGQAAQVAGAGHRRTPMLPCPAAVGRPQPGQRKGRQRCALRQNRLAVFDTQNVVRRAQQRPHAGAQGLGSIGPGGGIGHTGRKFFTDQRVYLAAQQQLRGVQQCGGIGGFRTEGQRIAAQRRQQMHPCRGELLRRGAGVGRGQRNDDVGPCAQRGAHPDALGQNRHTAALHRAAAQTDSHAVGARCPDRRKLGCMAVVKGVIFGYDACKFHRKNLPTDC